MRISLSALGALGALHVLVVSAADYCVGTCTNDLRNRFSEFSCTSAEDGACLCKNQSFIDGIKDCSSNSCGATEAEMNNYLSTNFCLGVISASSAASSVAATSAAATSAAAFTSETPSQIAISSTKIESTSNAPSSSSSEISSTRIPTTTAPKTTTAGSPSATEPSVTESASETGFTASGTVDGAGAGAGSSATATSAADSAESSNASEKKKDSGLSIAAQAGIGVGVGAAVLAILSLGLFCVLKSRRHQEEQKPSRRGIGLAISEPLPGGGRVYGSSDAAFQEKNAYDMEVITNRYEDMVPRHTPRVMV